MFPPESRKEFCVVSFEPNPRFTNALKKVSKDTTSAGYRLKVYTNTAAGDRHANILLHLDESSDSGFGSSTLKHKKVNFGGKKHALGKNVEVQQFKLSHMIEILENSVQIVAKMDIEGGEYQLLRSLISSGVACRLDVLVIEWHGHKIADKEKEWPANVEASIKWLLESKD
eukprot:8843205-Pyramimonas_sp.AAC.1